MEKERVEARWSGTYPNRCSGTWNLWVDGKDVSDLIPEELRNNDMGTFGIYSSWHFENWSEVFEEYEDGKEFDEWIGENSYWVSKITEDRDLQREIFDKLNLQDFRSGSCGGCI